MMFAGLWSPGEVESCAVITTAAPRSFAHIHDRVPLILNSSEVREWLNPASPLARLKEIISKGIEYNKCGILLNDLGPASEVQTNMLDHVDRDKSARLYKVMDSINRDWGDSTLHVAATGFSKAWSTRFSKRTPRYTSRWDELVTVKA